MQNRKIAKDEVSAIGFGAMWIGGRAYGEAPSDEERFKFLDRLIELGCTMWDSSDSYVRLSSPIITLIRGNSNTFSQPGDSEVIIGKYFARNPSMRSKVFLATKFGFTPNGIQGDPEYVRQAIGKLLGRLGLPTVPIEKTVGAMAEPVKEGKVRYLGLSEPSPSTLRRAQEVHPILAVQIEYSPFTLDMEKEDGLIETARELGIAIIAYSPLGRGVLTGKYKSWADISENDFRKMIPKYSEENFPKILGLVDKIKAIGEKHIVTAGQVALAWLLAQGSDIIPIPGTEKIKYLEENLGALQVRLTDDEIKEIRAFCESAEVPGTRYSESWMEMVAADTPPLK